MNNELNCKKCNKLMNPIPSLRGLKKEGQSVQKASNFLSFECINEECESFGKIINILAQELYGK